MSTLDRDRAAALGNTEALKAVMTEHVSAVAAERVEDEDAAWASRLGQATYAKILAQFVMDLLGNQQRHATQRNFKIHNENDAALLRSVTRVRQGGDG